MLRKAEVRTDEENRSAKNQCKHRLGGRHSRVAPLVFSYFSSRSAQQSLLWQRQRADTEWVRKTPWERKEEAIYMKATELKICGEGTETKVG